MKLFAHQATYIKRARSTSSDETDTTWGNPCRFIPEAERRNRGWESQNCECPECIDWVKRRGARLNGLKLPNGWFQEKKNKNLWGIPLNSVVIDEATGKITGATVVDMFWLNKMARDEGYHGDSQGPAATAAEGAAALAEGLVVQAPMAALAQCGALALTPHDVYNIACCYVYGWLHPRPRRPPSFQFDARSFNR